jgi:hypothetical protein
MVHKVGHKIGAGRKIIKSSNEKVDQVKDTREFIWVDAYGKKVPDGPTPRLYKTKKYIDISNDDMSPDGVIGDGDIESWSHNWDNPLHKFASYNTIFTLSGISEEELRDQTYFSNTPHDIIARSGGIGNPNITYNTVKSAPNFANGKPSFNSQMEKLKIKERASFLTGQSRRVGTSYEESLYFLKTGYDLFFENVNILSTTGPNPERGLANFTKMEFQLHEPFGVSFVEKVRAATFINGYTDYQDAPLLLTIEWKGWDEHGKEQKNSRLTRKIPIRIVRVSFEVDAGGAKYDCIAVAADDFAHDDRFKFPRTTITITRSDWPKWKASIKDQLDKQMDNEIEEGLRMEKDYYDFQLTDEVIKDAKNWGNDPTSIHHQDGRARLGAKIAKVDATVDSFTALTKLFEDAVRSGLGFTTIINGFWYNFARKLMNDSSIKPKSNDESMKKVTNYLTSKKFETDIKKEENQYINWFMIKPRFEVLYTKWDSIRKMHPKKVTYVAVRQKIHVLKFVKPGISLGNIDWSSYVRKKYNYIYTGENVDIQNLKIDYASAYYMRNLRPFIDEEKGKGKFKEFKNKFEERLDKIFGVEDDPDILLRQEPSVQRGKSVVQVDDPRQSENQQFYDYLTNPQADMMKIELTILGDPAYVCQDQFTNLRGNNSQRFVNQGSWNNRYGSFNSESYQPIILLTYKLPEDFKEKTGLFHSELPSRTMFFSGVYQVVKIESSFDTGQFTQVLHCVRLNNQKGKGMTAKMGTSVKKYFKDQQVIEDAKNAAERAKLKLLEKVKNKLLNKLKRSDIRLKENIQLIGKSLSNINIYSFKYKGEQGYYEGVMAHEVPWASIVGDDGYLMVDYSKVDVDFKRRRGFQKELTGAIN